VIQTADLRDGDDVTAIGRLDFARHRCVAIQGQVRARFVVVVEVIGQQVSWSSDFLGRNNATATLDFIMGYAGLSSMDSMKTQHRRALRPSKGWMTRVRGAVLGVISLAKYCRGGNSSLAVMVAYS
jgi:hypothetical protein